MKHTQIIDQNIVLNITNIFSYFFGILKIEIYTEDRECNEFKNFVKIKVLNNTILNWQYRDAILRDFYVKDKTIRNFKG